MNRKNKPSQSFGKLQRMVRLFGACKKIRNAIFQDCMGKHYLNPMESDLNPDYHVEVTFSIREIREFCFASRDAEIAITSHLYQKREEPIEFEPCDVCGGTEADFDGFCPQCELPMDVKPNASGLRSEPAAGEG